MWRRVVALLVANESIAAAGVAAAAAAALTTRASGLVHAANAMSTRRHEMFGGGRHGGGSDRFGRRLACATDEEGGRGGRRRAEYAMLVLGHLAADLLLEHANGGRVRAEHESERYVEGEHAAVQAERLVDEHAEATRRIVHARRVDVGERDKRRTDERRREPDGAQLEHGGALRLVATVLERKLDGQEAVERHRAHVLNARRAAQHVEYEPRGAHGRVIERKRAGQLDKQRHRHDESRDGEVRDGQRDEEHVGGRLQLALRVHGYENH